MNSELQNVCARFVEYRYQLREMNVFSSYHQLYPLCAYICMIRGQEPNEEIMNLCKQLLRERFGAFNMFRGNGEKVITALLACEGDPGAAADLCEEAYAVLRDEFSASHYLPMLAYYMATTMPPAEFEQFTYETRTLYQMFNDMHPFLTSEEDVLFIGLLNATKKNHSLLVNEAEDIWHALRDDFRWNKDALQTCAHALVLCEGEPMVKAARFYNLFRRLRDEGYRYGKGYEGVPLAILANLGIDQEQIVSDFIEAEQFLEQSGGYGFWAGFSSKARYMHAILVLSAYYGSGTSELNAAFIVSVLREIAEQQAAAAAAAA